MDELREIEAMAAEMSKKLGNHGLSFIDDYAVLDMIERLSRAVQLLRDELGLS